MMKHTNHIITIKDLQIKTLLKELVKAFYSANKDIYLVGGCVRDMILGKTPKDYDLCTDALPEEIKTIVSSLQSWHCIETGIKHGTVTAHDEIFGLDFEITTYRADGNYTDNRHPDSVNFVKSLEEDLKRRDFTINALVATIGGDVLEFEDNQLLDLNMGLIRCVGEANKRFQEDALRMLRAIRFAAQLNFVIETETWEAIKTNANRIVNISKERVRDELTKIVCSNHPEYLRFVYFSGLSKYILPILDEMMVCSQYNKYHYLDVANHTFEVMKGISNTPILRWAAFFHDCGKPKCKTTGEDGWEHFYGHPKVSRDIAEQYLTDFKFDNYSKETILKLVLFHDIDIKSTMKASSCRKNINTITKELMPLWIELHKADAFAHKPIDMHRCLHELSFITTFYEKMLTEKVPMQIKDLKVNGYDLRDLGLIGPEIGVTLKFLLNLVVETPSINTKEQLINYVVEHKKEILK